MHASYDPPEPAPEAPPSVTDFVDELVVALHALRVHESANERVFDVVRALESTLERLLAESGSARLELRLEHGCLQHDGRVLLGATLSATRVLDDLTRLGAGGLSFERGASAAEILALGRVLERRARGGPALEHVARALRAQGCLRARLLEAPSAAARGLATLRDLEGPVRSYQRLVEHLQDVMVRVCRRESFSLEPTRSVVAALIERLERDPDGLLPLARYERFDAFTFGPSIRVALLALEFARAHTHERSALTRLVLAALMHDVGRAWLPFELLHHAGRFDAAQRAQMELHVQHGAAILAAMDADPLCVAVAFGHHLRHDGGGYPRTAHAPQLSCATALVKICDVFEALTAPRPHRAALPPARAYRVMLAMNGHFDPRLLRRFVEVHGVHPVGSHVRLSTGESARVVAQSRHLDRPRVALTSLPDGTPLALEAQNAIDLSDERERRSIAGPLDPPASKELAA